MENNHLNGLNPKRRLSIILLAVLSVLLIPLIAMQFTQEVYWTPSDFLIAGVLLSGTGITLEMLLRKFKTFKSRFVAAGILFVIFFLIWAELAVGIFGTPWAGN